MTTYKYDKMFCPLQFFQYILEELLIIGHEDHPLFTKIFTPSQIITQCMCSCLEGAPGGFSVSKLPQIAFAVRHTSASECTILDCLNTYFQEIMSERHIQDNFDDLCNIQVVADKKWIPPLIGSQKSCLSFNFYQSYKMEQIWAPWTNLLFLDLALYRIL
jgi:hypothetical protein